MSPAKRTLCPAQHTQGTVGGGSDSTEECGGGGPPPPPRVTGRRLSGLLSRETWLSLRRHFPSDVSLSLRQRGQSGRRCQRCRQSASMFREKAGGRPESGPETNLLVVEMGGHHRVTVGALGGCPLCQQAPGVGCTAAVGEGRLQAWSGARGG